ncbi:MAG: DoxX family protein [Pseudomonadota bacterium]
MTAFLDRLSPLALSLLRAVSGLVFLSHGTQKLIGYPPTERVTEMFSLGWWAGAIELVTGALLVIGYQTRPAAFLASGTMAFAYWLAHAPQNPFPSTNGGVPAVLYCFVFFYLVFAGGGPVGVDHLRRNGKRKAAAQAAEAPAA